MVEASVKIVLRDGEESVSCPRRLLVKHSDYFKAMLESGHFREGNDSSDGAVVTIWEASLRPETLGCLPVLLSAAETPTFSRDYFDLLFS
uniref:BTB domain-containing protein n=1 Tax=Chromera velia CCMP2878 TaxID=1169474 RepID=A0A0G4HWV3_9ALVE|mmetsp:Transcript_42024/g.82950  ORF Transcript_42024/g.82950 Transcript_42024/m.82950 type:complete len:90 (-) Transcript_42024:715-984(-)|eukprot:Cvel_1454.t1-p1 / transcript=Cvel_1454.t1 / gene=Cvel_1454 / organism=Chromera_velia_CCMP2878 / gene_product=hypothetical protein / transcript_product=hypothetical protein / location=Cvel_scaffold51:33774-34040(-) / protein_length=89 / sequence_SO=supercontig / SO=protein_coding / is_pseudo=false